MLTKLGHFILLLLVTRPLVDLFVGSPNVIIASLPRVWGGLYVASLLCYLILVRFDVFSLRISRYAGLLIVSILPGIYFTEDYAYGAVIITKLISWMLSFLVFFHMFRFDHFLKRFGNLIPWFTYIFIIIYLLGLVLAKGFGYSIQPDGNAYAYGRYEGGFKSFFESVHGLSFQLIFLIFLEYGRHVFYKANTLRLQLLSVISSLFIIATLVRSALVALLIYWFGLLRNNLLVSVVIVLIIALSSTLIYSEAVVEDRLYEEVAYYEEGSTESYYALGSGRIGMWASCILYFSEANVINQIFGSGLDADLRATDKFYHKRAAHNDFIYFGLSTGLVGLSLFILLVYELFSSIFSRNSKRLGKTKNLKFIFWSVFALMNLQSITVSLSMIYFVVFSAYLYWSMNKQELKVPKRQTL